MPGTCEKHGFRTDCSLRKPKSQPTLVHTPMPMNAGESSNAIHAKNAETELKNIMMIILGLWKLGGYVGPVI